jgi:hypothetical protein
MMFKPPDFYQSQDFVAPSCGQINLTLRVVRFALGREDLGPAFKEYLKGIMVK